MVSWYLIPIAVFIAAPLIFVLAALICSGANADMIEEKDYWERQAKRMADRFGVSLPLGPGKGEL